MKDLNNVDIQIIKLMAEGLESEDIAKELKYKQGVVRVYRSRIYKKLGLRNAAHLIDWAYKNNVLTLDTSMKQQ